MADHQFLQNIKQSFSLADIDQNIDFMNHFSSGLINPAGHQENPAAGFMGFSGHENVFPAAQLSEFPAGLFIQEDHNNMVSPFSEPIISSESHEHKDRKRKVKEITTPESTSAYSSPQCSDNGIRKTNRMGRGKKVKSDENEDEKPKEVIHVRARRGQATDSHSLAERVRRGKINERLRCLQDIVPGCYKSMGMAVMLDETINYVQSLQSQVEFLSMKLTAASTFQDFNSDTDAMETMQESKAFDQVLKIQNAANQGLMMSSAQLGSLGGLNFGYYPQFPHSSR